ncbi:hypothetical protein A6763_18340 [Aeromonas caviae]|nr:hypothetical protein A6763_18340 [Aeromonas caviae]
MDFFRQWQGYTVPLAICLLFMWRNRIVNQGLNTLLSQISLQFFTLSTAHNKKVPNMCQLIYNIRQCDHWIREPQTISLSNLLATNGLSFQIRQLYTQHGSLNLIKTAIYALIQVFILFMRPIITQSFQSLSQFIIISCNGTSVTQRTEIFTWVKAKASSIAPVTGSLAINLGTMSLSTIFQHQ